MQIAVENYETQDLMQQFINLLKYISSDHLLEIKSIKSLADLQMGPGGPWLLPPPSE